MTTKEVVEKNGGQLSHLAFQLESHLIIELGDLIDAFCEGDVINVSKYIDFKTLHTLNKCFGYYLKRDQVLELSLTIKNKRCV